MTYDNYERIIVCTGGRFVIASKIDGIYLKEVVAGAFSVMADTDSTPHGYDGVTLAQGLTWDNALAVKSLVGKWLCGLERTGTPILDLSTEPIAKAEKVNR